MHLLLFDLDGTLLLTQGAGMRSLTRAGKQLFGDRFSLEGVLVSGGLDPLLYAEAARRSGIVDPSLFHNRFRDLYLEILVQELTANQDQVSALPGISNLLDEVCERNNLVVGLVTGNYEKASYLKLQSAGIDAERFVLTVFGDEAESREALVHLAIKRGQQHFGEVVDPHKVIVIGDTPRDVDAAHANEALCLAVATGRYSVEDLTAAGADVTVADFSDTSPLFTLISDTLSLL